jgi:broad specificity phosphatase PhoE
MTHDIPSRAGLCENRTVSRLLLIRHGQASFGAQDYDQLSELGRRQGLALGNFWVSFKERFDAIYCGPRRRHKDTLDAAIIAAERGELSLPPHIEHEGLDEYPAIELFKKHLGDVSALPSVRQIRERIADISGRWIEGTLELDGLESYEEFHARVVSTLEAICKEQGRGKTVAVMTSGGPISIAMKAALDLEPQKAGRLAWVIANASITEFHYRDDGLHLRSFNRTPHLGEHSLVTYI